MTTEQLAALKKIADRAIPPFWNAQSEELFVRQFKEAFHPAGLRRKNSAITMDITNMSPLTARR
jgi:hypothetical protein